MKIQTVALAMSCFAAAIVCNGAADMVLCERGKETLDFRPLRFSRNSRYSFRHSHFCIVHVGFHLRFSPIQNAPLPSIKYCLSFGYTLSPVKSSAQHHSTSELLRTLLMSGCF